MLLRLLAWCLAAAVTFATLGPPNYRPHANLGQNGDHALAFLLVGFAFGLAYRDKLRVTALAAVVTTGCPISSSMRSPSAPALPWRQQSIGS